MTPFDSTLDYNEIWKQKFDANTRCHGGTGCSSIWNDKRIAERFLKSVTKSDGTRIAKTLADLPLTPTSRVLDIGAGPGTLAIPMAKIVSHVTAVEPADGMATLLIEQARTHGIKNITVVKRRWEETDTGILHGPFDLTIASYSLGMPDIRKAIGTMTDVTNGLIALYVFAGPTPWERQMAQTWPELHGKDYRPGPKADVLFNVLFQMGIVPKIQVFSHAFTERFASATEAVERMAPRFMAESPAQKEILKDFLSRILIPEKAGLIICHNTRRVKFWWNTGDPVEGPGDPQENEADAQMEKEEHEKKE